MTELLTAAQMRAIEQAAIESGEVTGLELMERAGRGVVEAIFEEWPELDDIGGPAPQTPRRISDKKKRAVVLCGPGNNGGDGFVVARLLKERGWEVEVFLYGDPEKLPPDARVNYERWGELGTVGDLNLSRALADLDMPNLLIDAVFGTGLVRKVEGHLAQILSSLDTLRVMRHVKVVAIDMPSGMCSDSGKHLGVFASADLTVSFHTAKVGHYLNRGPVQSGKTIVKPIGLERCLASPGDVVTLIEAPRQRAIDKFHTSHKYTHGHALILTGGPGKTGAARLAARGALRIGAGLVTLGVPPSAQQEVSCQITALMLTRVADGDALCETLQDDRLNALCLGPGLGLHDQALDLVAAALGTEAPGHVRGYDASINDPQPRPTSRGLVDNKEVPDQVRDCVAQPRPIVFDADALTLISQHDELFAALHDQCILTPHAGEFRRLFPDIAERLNAPATKGPAYSKVDATRDAAKRAGCIVLFKGPDTVIAAPDGRCSINAAVYDRAAPWLATAGSGDVLAGFITGLLARGLPPMQAAETAAWLHVECARSFGPGLIAEDLPEELPKVFKELDM